MRAKSYLKVHLRVLFGFNFEKYSHLDNEKFFKKLRLCCCFVFCPNAFFLVKIRSESYLPNTYKAPAHLYDGVHIPFKPKIHI